MRQPELNKNNPSGVNVIDVMMPLCDVMGSLDVVVLVLEWGLALLC